MTRAVLSVLRSEEAKVTGEEKTVFATNGVKHLGVNMQKKKRGGEPSTLTLDRTQLDHRPTYKFV